ncbi:MAG: hypothetical protein AAB779_02405, partial [Patescibacteria group bacterium]
QQETLDHKINGPKSVFTVLDNIQTPKITAITGNLTISTASSTSLTIGTATTTGATIQIKAGPSQNLLLSGDSNVGLYVTAGGYVGIATSTPSSPLYVYSNSALSVPLVDVTQNNSSATGYLVGLTTNAHSIPSIRFKSAVSVGSAQNEDWYVGQLNINDDAAGTVYSGSALNSVLLIFGLGGGSGIYNNGGAFITAIPHSSPNATIISQGGNYTWAVTTDDVSGATKVDGQVTVSVRSGVIEIENRTGGTVNISYFVLD